MKEDLVELITAVAQDLLAEEEQTPVAPLDADTRLFGKHGLFDSMGLVSLIVAVEQEIEDRHGVSVALADEKALSQSSSPYRTIGTLAEYAAAQLAPAA